MSIKYMLDAFKARTGSHARKLVLLKLADNASDTGECFPSYQHIADQCEMSRRSVISHINQLSKDGFLAKKVRRKRDGDNHSNIYTLIMQETRDPSAKSAPPPSAKSAPITSHSLEPVNEPKEKNKRKNSFVRPSENEINDYAITENLQLDGMYDFYQSNGWKVGRNAMKDWQATARNWSRRNGTQRKQTVSGQPNNAANRAHERNKRAYAEAVARELGDPTVQQVSSNIR